MYKTISTLIFVVISAAIFCHSLLNTLESQSHRQGTAVPPNNDWLEPLIPGANYNNWYQQSTGYIPNPNYFGAYTIVPYSSTLHLGFGTARPAERDGALLAQTDGLTVTAVATLTEQGFIDMAWVSNTLYIPGADPCCGDGWDAGNFYVKSATSPITKYRNLPNVFHAWGFGMTPMLISCTRPLALI